MAFRILFTALLATAVGQSVFLTTLPSLGREAGISEFQVAIIMSSSAMIFALGTTFWSRIAKRWGFHRTLVAGLTGYSVGTGLFATVWYLGLGNIITGTALFISLLVARTLQSTIMSATPPSVVGYAIAVSTPGERVKAISRVTSANNLGQILGPTYAGALVTFGLLAPLYSIVLITLLAVFLVWRKLPPVTPRHQGVSEAADTQSGTGSLHSNTLLLVSMSAAVFCAMAMMQQSLAFMLIDDYHETPVTAAQKTGIAMMISAIASLTIQWTLVQRARIAPQKLIMLALPLLCAAYLLMYTHWHLTSLYIAMALMGLGMGISYPSIAAVATSTCRPEKQGTVTGMITATPAMGYIVGPPVAAAAYSVTTRLPFLASAILMALFSVLAIASLRKKHRRI